MPSHLPDMGPSGLRTRKWDEVRPALVNMVAAANRIRATAD